MGIINGITQTVCEGLRCVLRSNGSAVNMEGHKTFG